jgi:hypothetical protein
MKKPAGVCMRGFDGNHYHLFIEMPEGNLVDGMRWRKHGKPEVQCASAQCTYGGTLLSDGRFLIAGGRELVG